MLRKSSGCASDQAVNGIATFLKYINQNFGQHIKVCNPSTGAYIECFFGCGEKNKNFFLSKTLYLVRILTKISIYRGSIFITKVFEKILRKPLQYKALCGIIIRHDCGKWGKYALNTIS